MAIRALLRCLRCPAGRPTRAGKVKPSRGQIRPVKTTSNQNRPKKRPVGGTGVSPVAAGLRPDAISEGSVGRDAQRHRRGRLFHPEWGHQALRNIGVIHGRTEASERRLASDPRLWRSALLAVQRGRGKSRPVQARPTIRKGLAWNQAPVRADQAGSREIKVDYTFF